MEPFDQENKPSASNEEEVSIEYLEGAADKEPEISSEGEYPAEVGPSEEGPGEEPPEEDFKEEREKPKKKKPGFGSGILVGVLGVIAVCAVAFIVFFAIRLNQIQKTQDTGSTDLSAYSKTDLIRAYLSNYYLYGYDDSNSEDNMARGLMDNLGDKYAAYYTAEEFAELQASTNGVYYGIGVKITTDDDGRIYVYSVTEGSPAEEAGIKVGDYIVEADGNRDFADMDELVTLVRGEEGTTVNIVVERDGQEISVDVERRAIDQEIVKYTMLDNNIGYIYITEFDKVVVDQFNEALEDLQSQGMTSLILDVRYNPGGDYDTIVSVLDRILPAGTIITTKDINGTEETATSDEENQLTLPMVVLVNENTASAAELFSGAIQDYGLATIVGTQTYGKGIVQSVISLPDGSGIKFTTSEYFLPSGRSINEVGVTPDIVCELPEGALDDNYITTEEDTQLAKAIEILSGQQ